MSNHFTGLRLGPPAEHPRLDLTDLFAFQAPADPTRTVLILNANTKPSSSPHASRPRANPRVPSRAALDSLIPSEGSQKGSR